MSGAGTVDLANKTMGFRVEPKLVMTIEGQGGSANPVGLGIPVIVRGTWSAPDIYPDMAGILDNPDAAYAKLREMGNGLFGSGAGGGRASDQLGATLGTLIQQGLGAAAGRPTTAAPGAPNAQTTPPAPDQPSPMNGILQQLFGR
jgi:AsmA protein